MNHGDQYEFDERQAELIRQLAVSMRVVSTAVLCFGLLYLLGFVLSIIHAVENPRTFQTVVSLAVAMVFTLAMGILTYNAALSFRAIVDTRGADIGHLMTALESLRQQYAILSGIILLCIALYLGSHLLAWLWL